MLNFARFKATSSLKSLKFNKLVQINTQFRAFCTTPEKSSTMSEVEEQLKKAKENIYRKTREGVKTLKVMNQVEYNKDGTFYNRAQEYEHFIERMMQIYNEKTHTSSLDTAKSTSTSVSIEDALEEIAQDRRAKGFTAPAMSHKDNHFEFEQSVYMTHLADEIQYACLPGQFFPPYKMYRTLSQLAELKYKNTELISSIKHKLTSYNTENDEPTKDLDAFKQILGDKTGRRSSYEIYKGFENSKEFYSHLETLLNWNSEDEVIRAAEREAQALSEKDKAEATEILELMKHILQAGKEIQSYQKEMAESIEAVRSQYIHMSEAFDQHKFLQNNKYIKLDLLKLQEKMVKAGLMDPYESIGTVPLESLPLTERMGRATEIFYDLTKDYYPELAPKLTGLFEFEDSKSKRQSLTLKDIEKNNELSLKYIGLILGKLAEIRNSVRRDVVDNDFMNQHFREKMFGNEEFENPHKKKEEINNIKLRKNYTRLWNEVTQIFNSLLPEIKTKLDQGDSQDLILLLYGLTSGQVTDKSLISKVLDKIIEQFRKDKTVDLTDYQLILGAQGIAQ